jgi:hypothetical protein
MKPIAKLRRKIATLERRIDHLNDKLKSGFGSEQSLGYDRDEREALSSAIIALELYEKIRWPEMSPVVALQSLLDELDRASIPDQTNDHDEIAVAVTKARRTLKALEGIV